MDKKKLYTLFKILTVSFLFFVLNTVSEIKIPHRKTETSKPKNNIRKNKNQFLNQNNALIMQKNQSIIQNIVSNAMATLQHFEILLETIVNVISQKIVKMTPKQARLTEEYLRQVMDMRNFLYETREKILSQIPQNPKQIPFFLENLSSLMSIVVTFSESLDYSISNKFNKVKQFNIMSTMTRTKQKNQAKFLTKHMFAVQDHIESIKEALNDFDLTKTNKFFQRAHQYIVIPFFQYYVNSILWYATLWGTPAAFFLWQWGGRMANAAEFNHLRNTKTIDDYHTNPDNQQRPLPDKEDIFPVIYKSAPGEKIKLDDGYKKTLSRSMRFFYWLCDKDWLKFPSSYFSAPDAIDPNKGASYGYKKRQWHGNAYKSGLIGTIDDTITGYFANYFPILSFAIPTLAPTIQQVWNNQIYPQASGNITKLWNKLMGGLFENRSKDWAFELIISDLTLDDVIGMENEKVQLEILIEYLLDPIGFSQKHGDKIDKAFVFTGPTRTGKTHLYKAFVGSLQRKLRMNGRTLRSVRAYEFPVHIVKQTGITQIMELMKTMAPAVFFIDEIDLVQLQRSTDGTVLADFLTGLGNVLNDDPSRPVILFCATNKIENLDRALRTKGRLGEEIRFDYPSYSHRKEFLSRIFKKLGLDKQNINIDEIVQQLNEQAYETISYILNGAMMRASVDGIPFAQEHFEEAIDRSIRGIMNASRKDLVQEEQSILAAHFSGHIVAFLLLQLSEILHKVTIKAVAPQIKEESIYADLYQKEEQKQKKIVFGAIYVSANGDSDKLATKEMRINTIKRLLSGYVAEELLLGSCGYTCHAEYKDEAYKIALDILLAGIQYDSLPEKLKALFTQQAIELINRYTEEIRILFRDNKKLLEYMSNALLQHETVSRKQILELYEQFKQKQEETYHNEVVK